MKWLGFALGVLLLVLTGGVLWLDRLFEDPDARRIESLAAELGTQRLLAVVAHPDDEITAAGALADAAARGAAVHVITATRGEKGTPDIPISGPEELAKLRAAELLEHGTVLGFAEQQVWELPDGDVSRHLESVTADLVREIRRIDPDTVLTFHSPSGYSDHPDHMAMGAAATRAVETVRESGRDLTLVYVLGPRRVMDRFAGEMGARVAANQPPATFAIRIDPAIKLRGWAIHASQADHIRRNFGVPAWLLYRLFDEEHYLLAE
jgi:LmbE family N-acetylglucosaminyl deacetylase